MIIKDSNFTLARKTWSWGDNYIISAGDSEKEVYKIEGKAFSWRKKFKMLDMNEQIILHCIGEGSWFSFNFGIYDRFDVLQARIIQDSVWSSRNYTLQFNDGTTYKIGGNLSKTHFIFRQNDTVVAEASRPLLSFERKYNINISTDESYQKYMLISLAAMDIIQIAQSSS